MVRIRATELYGVAGLLKTLLPCTVLGKALCSAPLWWVLGTAAVLGISKEKLLSFSFWFICRSLILRACKFSVGEFSLMDWV